MSDDKENISKGTEIVAIWNANKQNYFLKNLDCQIKLDFSSNSEKLGMVFDNSKIS